LKQTYNHIEVIVSDDASTDNTLGIVEKFKDSVDFPVTVISHKPNGIGANWNNSIKHAKGEYIKFLFQDDVLLPTCISEMVPIFQENKNVELVACKRDFIVETIASNKVKEWIEKYKDLQAQFDNN